MRLKLVKLDYIDDCKRIRRAVADAGYECSLAEAQWLWEQHSAEQFAGWLGGAGSLAGIFEAIEPYIKLVDCVTEKGGGFDD